MNDEVKNLEGALNFRYHTGVCVGELRKTRKFSHIIVSNPTVIQTEHFTSIL
jgi:hypothetical protein